jgi:hypothetical protein
MQQLAPSQEDSFYVWWLQARKRVPKLKRRGVDVLVLLNSDRMEDLEGEKCQDIRKRNNDALAVGPWRSKKRRCNGIRQGSDTLGRSVCQGESQD